MQLKTISKPTRAATAREGAALHRPDGLDTHYHARGRTDSAGKKSGPKLCEKGRMGPSSRVYEVIYFTTCRELGKGRASQPAARIRRQGGYPSE